MVPIQNSISYQDRCLCAKPEFYHERISVLNFHFFPNTNEIFYAAEGWCSFKPWRVLWSKPLHLKKCVVDKGRLTCKWAMGPYINLQRFNHSCGHLAFITIKYMKIKASGFPVQRHTVYQEEKQCPSRYVVVDTWRCITYLVNRWLNGILYIFYYHSFENDWHNTLLPSIV